MNVKVISNTREHLEKNVQEFFDSLDEDNLGGYKIISVTQSENTQTGIITVTIIYE